MSKKPKLHSFPPPHQLSESLNRFFSGRNGDDLSRLCSLLPAQWDLYLMGGVVRNLLLNELRGIKVTSADVDIVVNGAESASELLAVVQDFYIRQNDFGGAKCRIHPGGMLFDIWRIDDHATVSSTPRPHTIEQLLRHNLLDVDAVLFALRTGYLYDYGCLAAIKAGRIDLLGNEGISKDFAAAQAAHAILIAFKTGFELSDAAIEFVSEICEDHHAKSDVISIVYRKMPVASGQIDVFLKALLEEEPWPTMSK